ncbi:TetR/AcrR family transcriptional regulator [Lacisediminihabitans profunda]|uniref:TetR/AcrR family transcriptional regulator n=1 Tax=Lacisediminihabitans profunda TaxID=2594790 RepID=UPI0016509273|nr:TetR family transcriptional regulator [Lacisediminihabitans profunda]
MAGSTAKGEARRTALLDAVVRVLERGGPGAVTHRAVAAEAGVPLAAATYYFSNIDDLLVSALLKATEEQVELFARLETPGIGEVARMLHDWTHTRRAAVIAQYELLFLAMRREALRDAAERWYRALENALGGGRGSRVAALAIDGLVLRILWSGEPSTVAGIEAALADIFEAAAALG